VENQSAAIHVPIYTKARLVRQVWARLSGYLAAKLNFHPQACCGPIAPDRGFPRLGGRGTFRIEEFPPNPLRFCICALRFGVLLASSRPIQDGAFDGSSSTAATGACTFDITDG